MIVWKRTFRGGWWFLPLIHWGLPRLVPWPFRSAQLPLPQPVRWIGRVLLLLGSSLTGWAVVHMVHHGGGTPAPHDPPTVLMRDGPYRYSRNPMELGNILALVGRALTSGSPRLVLASLCFALGTHAWIVLIEEPYLYRHFGQHYRAYQHAVPRWGWRRPHSER